MRKSQRSCFISPLKKEKNSNIRTKQWLCYQLWDQYISPFSIKVRDKSLRGESRVHWVVTRFREECKCGKQATSKERSRVVWWTQHGVDFPFQPCPSAAHGLKIKKVLQLCGFESRRETGGCQAKGWTGAWINGQPGYFHMGWQSEPTDHRSLARRSNSRVPSVVWPIRQQWKPSAREVVEGRERSEIGSAINVDLKTYSLLQPELLPAVSQTRT